MWANFLMFIHGNIEDQFYAKKLIPQKFATVESLLSALESFKVELNKKQELLDINTKGEDTDFIVCELQKIKTELIEAIDFTKNIYDYEDTFIPYQELRYFLITNNIDEFIKGLKSILASVSYSIAKSSEGFQQEMA